jgi:hypothetical protein
MTSTNPTSQQGSPKRKRRLPLAVVIVSLAIIVLAGFVAADHLKTSSPMVSNVVFIFTGIAAFVMIGCIAYDISDSRTLSEVSTSQVERATERFESEPEKTQPAWELARSTLQLYFNRNLHQINSIFWLATAVMAAGFSLICYGVWLAITQKDSPAGPIIAGASGVISQLIGATFLFVYKSTLQQADKFVRQLERMNAIGMAMQILDTMKDDASESNLKDKTKATLIDLFVRHAHSSAGLLRETEPAADSTGPADCDRRSFPAGPEPIPGRA